MFVAYETTPEIKYIPSKTGERTEKSLGFFRVIDVEDELTDGMTKFTQFDHPVEVLIKNGKIQRFVSYTKKGVIQMDYLCKDGEIIIVKNYDKNGVLKGSLLKKPNL